MFHSKNNMLAADKRCSAFTIAEIVTALVILTMITTSVLVVMNRCVSATIDSRAKMEAFELARDNMERLLASEFVKEMAEFGTSEKNEDIEWETVVESFYEPITSRMWIQAVCSASYTDSIGEIQEIKLTHWLTNVSRSQMLKIVDQQKREREYLDEIDPDGTKPDPEDPEDPQKPKEPKPPVPDDDLICGYTKEQLMAMDISELFRILTNCKD